MPDQTKETIPISTRFDPGELEKLKQAAGLKQWSVAQLVRLGAYEKAVNILNANGDRFYAARRYVAPVVKQLLDPDLHAGIIQDGEDSACVSALGQGQFDGFLRAVRALGPELASILEDESKRIRSWAKTFPELIDPAPAMGQSVGVIAGSSGTEAQASVPPFQPKRRRRRRPAGKEK